MLKFHPEQIVNLAAEIGVAFLTSSAETYRVEESAFFLLKAYGIEEPHVFALANYITVACTVEGRSYSSSRRVMLRTSNLQRIDELNKLTRTICTNTPNPSEAMVLIKQIKSAKLYPMWAQIAATSMIGFGFTLLLQASLLASFWAAIISALMRIIIIPFQRKAVNQIFINLIGGFVITVMAYPATYIPSLAQELSVIITGSFMYLFPGLQMTNGLRDIITNDYVAGLTKLIETILVAASIALGSGLAFRMIGYF